MRGRNTRTAGYRVFLFLSDFIRQQQVLRAFLFFPHISNPPASLAFADEEILKVEITPYSQSSLLENRCHASFP